jgi:hypothetical protein
MAKIICFFKNNLVINSPTPARRCLYTYPRIFDTTSTSTAINWDPAYSKVDINRNETNRYIRHDPKRRFFTTSYNHGSFAQHDVLFQGNPISGVATTKEYTEITTRNGASIATGSVDTSSVRLVWRGLSRPYPSTITHLERSPPATRPYLESRQEPIPFLDYPQTRYTIFRITPVSTSEKTAVSSVVSAYTPQK